MLYTDSEYEKFGLVKNLLTIAVPTYNGGGSLPDLISSVEKLGLKSDEFEILIVDNCSDDDTEAVINELLQFHSNIKYYRNPYNIGRIENWNKAIELSKGEFLILMNVNDIFLEFDVKKYLGFLSCHDEISMVLTDMAFENAVYPSWNESGVVNLVDYIRKTFLDKQLLEFHSVGVLHQHIFRTNHILKYGIKFNKELPRTTDRVFAAELTTAGGGKFYYTNKCLTSWRLNSRRYHYTVHLDKKSFDFEELWVNEFKANHAVANTAQISMKDFLVSQLTLASSYIYKFRLAELSDTLRRRKSPRSGMEFPTAGIFYEYLATIARLNGIRINYSSIKFTGLLLVIKEFLRHHKVIEQKERSIKDIVFPTELEQITI
jgi:glycosyltransferase involved in cell wall biosynthesis